jgi:hypothetical protein
MGPLRLAVSKRGYSRAEHGGMSTEDRLIAAA